MLRHFLIFLTFQRSECLTRYSLFDVEFADKKNYIFSFFHILKICGAIQNTANCQLWSNQPVGLAVIVSARGSLVVAVGPHQTTSCCRSPGAPPASPRHHTSQDCRLWERTDLMSRKVNAYLPESVFLNRLVHWCNENRRFVPPFAKQYFEEILFRSNITSQLISPKINLILQRSKRIDGCELL